MLYPRDIVEIGAIPLWRLVLGLWRPVLYPLYADWCYTIRRRLVLGVRNYKTPAPRIARSLLLSAGMPSSFLFNATVIG